MIAADTANGIFIAGGAVAVWMNVRKLWADREAKGVSCSAWVFFTAWSGWNLLYYPSFGQWISFVGSVALCLGNISWLVSAYCLARRS